VCGDAVDHEQTAERSGGLRPGEDIGKVVVQHERDERADRQEGNELDHRFKGDRGDHAFVALAGVDMARAEQNRECRHC